MAASQLIERLRQRIAALSPDSPEMKTALTRIGTVLSSEAKLNIRRNRLIDTGRLVNSIHWKLFTGNDSVGVEVGSYGVPYARVHEFGFRGIVQVPQHRRRAPSGTVHSVRSHSRKANIQARPYLRPAIKKHRRFIVDLIASVFSKPRGL